MCNLGYLSWWLGSASTSLLHDLKKLGLVPWSLCRPLTAWMAHWCSGRAWYMIRASSAVPVCRVWWSSLHLILGCQASWGCFMGSSAGLQVSWVALWAHWWVCIRSCSVGKTDTAASLPLRAWLAGVFLVPSGLGLLTGVLCRGVLCPLVSRASSCLLTAFHCIGRDKGETQNWVKGFWLQELLWSPGKMPCGSLWWLWWSFLGDGTCWPLM